MPTVATGLDLETARHWQNVLQDLGIDAEVTDSGDVVVAEADLAQAKALFEDPFGDEEGEADAELEVPPLDPSDRTEVLARTDDFVAARRLADLLLSVGLYATVDESASANVLGVEPPTAVIHIAASQREKAFAELEAFARQYVDKFQGAQNIDPEEVVEAMLLAPLGMIRVAPKKKGPQ
jgi:hypothetical protein